MLSSDCFCHITMISWPKSTCEIQFNNSIEINCSDFVHFHSNDTNSRPMQRHRKCFTDFLSEANNPWNSKCSRTIWMECSPSFPLHNGWTSGKDFVRFDQKICTWFVTSDSMLLLSLSLSYDVLPNRTHLTEPSTRSSTYVKRCVTSSNLHEHREIDVGSVRWWCSWSVPRKECFSLEEY